MKTKFSVLTIAAVATGTLIFTGCNTEDLSTPTIVLEGDSPYTIVLGGTWDEPGFSATDDEDGDISALVTVDSSDINLNEIGEYEVTYTVTDEAGNTGVETRIVRVVVGKANYLGVYQVHEICDMDEDGILGEPGVEYEINDYTVEILSGTDADELVFTNFGAYGTEVVVSVYFSGDLDEVLTVDNFNVEGSEIYFDADGIVTTAEIGALEFDLDYSASEGAVVVPCEATFVKL